MPERRRFATQPVQRRRITRAPISAPAQPDQAGQSLWAPPPIDAVLTEAASIAAVYQQSVYRQLIQTMITSNPEVSALMRRWSGTVTGRTSSDRPNVTATGRCGGPPVAELVSGEPARLPLSDQRLRNFFVRDREILIAFNRTAPDQVVIGLDVDLPAGFVIRVVEHDRSRRAFKFTVYHGSYDIVPAGDAVPNAGCLPFRYQILQRDETDGRYDLRSCPLD